ncbi:hypothetical protein [Pseudogemmobacter bohemicus]|uniref:hypothetical protein n=1 Tax=Pseudogemmobacter bohemicus TaxID=2250708 RepID=UPI000DD32458|nr:hypothetical protein [Pseudogemmobacter bohemicus]
MAGDKPDPREIAMAAGRALLAEREAGGQLDMFGGDQGEAVPVEDRRGPGRPAGSSNKLRGKIRELMAARGYRDPAEQLAMLAGLDRPDLHPLGYAAQIAATLGEPVMLVAREMRQAAAELMPYWHAKITPDIAVQAPAVNILMAGDAAAVAVQGAMPGAGAGFAPLDVRMMQIEQNQQVSGGDAAASDDE